MKDISIASEVTGSVWKLLVAPGDKVLAEQPVAVVESMKMEIEVLAPADGEVVSVLVAEGEMVEEEQALVVIRPAS